MKRAKKRVTDGGGVAPFIGFGHFASTTPPAPPNSSSSSSIGGNSSSQGINSAVPQLSPVYTGSDPSLSLLLQRLQKKDPKTKVNALVALKEEFTKAAKKPLLRDVLLNYLFVIKKLTLDNDPSVRKNAMLTLSASAGALPKLLLNLLLSNPSVLNIVHTLVSDPYKGVGRAADECMSRLVGVGLVIPFREVYESKCEVLGMRVSDFSLRIVSGSLVSNGNGGMKGGGMKKKSKRDGSSNISGDNKGNMENNNSDEMAAMEDRYDRSISSTLLSASTLFENLPPSELNDLDLSLILKQCNSKISKFRRGGYRALSCYVNLVPSFSKHSEGIATLVSSVMSTEKDANNHETMWELIFTFLKISKSDESAFPPLNPSNSRAICKAAAKQIRNNFYGSMTSSSKSLLLLVALLPRELLHERLDLQEEEVKVKQDVDQNAFGVVLKALSDKIQNAGVGNDAASYIEAIIECSCFLLMCDSKCAANANEYKFLTRPLLATLKLVMTNPKIVAAHNYHKTMLLNLFKVDNSSKPTSIMTNSQQTKEALWGELATIFSLTPKNLLTYMLESSSSMTTTITDPTKSNLCKILKHQFEVHEKSGDFKFLVKIVSTVQSLAFLVPSIQSFYKSALMRQSWDESAMLLTESCFTGLNQEDFKILWGEIVASDIDLSRIVDLIQRVELEPLYHLMKSSQLDCRVFERLEYYSDNDGDGDGDSMRLLEIVLSKTKSAVVKDGALINSFMSTRLLKMLISCSSALGVILKHLGEKGSPCSNFFTDGDNSDFANDLLQNVFDLSNGVQSCEEIIEKIPTIDTVAFLSKASKAIRTTNAEIDHNEMFKLLKLSLTYNCFDETFENVGCGDPSFWRSCAGRQFLFDGGLKELFALTDSIDYDKKSIAEIIVQKLESTEILSEICRLYVESVIGNREFEQLLSDEMKVESLTSLTGGVEIKCGLDCLKNNLENALVLDGNDDDDENHGAENVLLLKMMLCDVVSLYRVSKINPLEVREGDKYLHSDTDEIVTIHAIHKDDWPNVYFTLVENDKQTIADKLMRISERPPRKKSLEEEAIATILRPAFDSFLKAAKNSGSEGKRVYFCAVLSLLLNVRDGALVAGPKGLGSVKYEVSKLLASLTSVESLAIIGNNNWDALEFIGIESFVREKLLPNKVDNPRAVIIFLSGAVSEIEDCGLLRGVSEIVNSILQNSVDSLVMLYSLRFLIAFRKQAKRLYQMGNGFELGKEPSFSNLSRMVKQYCSDTPDDDCNIYLDEAQQRFRAEFESFVFASDSMHGRDENSLKMGVDFTYTDARVVEDMLGGSSVRTQMCCYRLINLVAKTPLMSATTVNERIEKFIAKNVSTAFPSYETEEREDIEDNVLEAVRLIPAILRKKLEESGADEGLKTTNAKRGGGNVVINLGQILAWIAFVDYVDCAAKSDSTKRNQLAVYVDAIQIIRNLMDCFSFMIREDLTQLNSDLLDEYRGGEEDLLSGIGYYGFFRTVQAFPGLVKRWFDQDAERNSKAIAVNFLEKQAGRLILKKELDIINKSKSSDLVGDMNITGSLVSREVVATYLQDESLLEVTIKLPKCFPLRNAEVDCSKSLGIKDSVSKRWQIMMIRGLEKDGGILDSFVLWKRNIDAEFEGVEPCPICYAVLDVKTHRLPTLTCRTCNSCFHNKCLFKWFSNSGKNECVICQQPWR